MSRSRSKVAAWAGLCLAAMMGCGGATGAAREAQEPAPPPPEPPRDPVAWLPASGPLFVHVDLAAWRKSPLSQYMTEFGDVSAEWLDLSRVEHAYAALDPGYDTEPTGVGVLTGDFGEGYLAARAASFGGPAKPYGDVDVYAYEDTYWVQVWPNLLVGCSEDRIDWVVARFGGGPGVELQDAPVYEKLGGAIQFEQAHVGVLMSDTDGEARAVLDQSSSPQALAVSRALAHVMHAALRIQWDDGVALQALGQLDEAARAEELRALLAGYLDRFRGNPLVMLFGLRDILGSFQVGAEAERVRLTAHATQAQIDALIGRVKPMLEEVFEELQGPAAPAEAGATPGGPEGVPQSAAQVPAEGASPAE